MRYTDLAMQKTNSIRAIFIDVDGTLVGLEDHVTPRVRAAIDAARALGCEVVLCTGRSRFTAQPIAKQISPPFGYLVCSNGGVTMHLETGEILYRHLLTISTALEVARAIIEVGAEPYIYEDGTGEGVESSRVLHHPELPVGPFAKPPRYRPHAALLEDLPFAPVSVCAFGSPSKMTSLLHLLRERLPAEVGIIRSGTKREWGIEVFVKGVSKRTGLEAVAGRLGLEREEILAIGDHLNDLEMLEWAGIGVAMGDAIEEVCAVADWVTSTVEEDGVARAIERFVLTK